jgi:hypothetical protein
MMTMRGSRTAVGRNLGRHRHHRHSGSSWVCSTTGGPVAAAAAVAVAVVVIGRIAAVAAAVAVAVVVIGRIAAAAAAVVVVVGPGIAGLGTAAAVVYPLAFCVRRRQGPGLCGCNLRGGTGRCLCRRQRGGKGRRRFFPFRQTRGRVRRGSIHLLNTLCRSLRRAALFRI